MPDRKEKKKELILNAAFKLFLENGYTNTRIIDIANATGIGKGTVYEYFDSKESILLELIHTKLQKESLRFQEVMSEDISCREKLTRFLIFQMEAASTHNLCVTDFKQQFFNDMGKIAVEIINTVHNAVLSQFEAVYQIIREGIENGEFRRVDPYAATVCFIGGIGFYISTLHEKMPMLYAKYVLEANEFHDEDSILDLIFNGLLA